MDFCQMTHVRCTKLFNIISAEAFILIDFADKQQKEMRLSQIIVCFQLTNRFGSVLAHVKYSTFVEVSKLG